MIVAGTTRAGTRDMADGGSRIRLGEQEEVDRGESLGSESSTYLRQGHMNLGMTVS